MKIIISQNQKRGFTLIELLVVIAIIGLMSSVILVSVNYLRKKSRDTRRFEDARELIMAIERYHIDNGHFPCAQAGDPPRTQISPLNQNNNCLARDLVPDYLKSLPLTPANADSQGFQYQYYVHPSKQAYYVRIPLETRTRTLTSNDPFSVCPATAGLPQCDFYSDCGIYEGMGTLWGCPQVYHFGVDYR